MTIVKTTSPILYDARHQYSSILEFEIVGFEEIQGGGVNVKVADYYYKDVEVTNELDEIVTISQRIQRCVTNVAISKEKMDAIALAVSPLVPEGLAESDRRELLKKFALLHYLKTDKLISDNTKCIYGLSENDFEFKE